MPIAFLMTMLPETWVFGNLLLCGSLFFFVKPKLSSGFGAFTAFVIAMVGAFLLQLPGQSIRQAQQAKLQAQRAADQTAQSAGRRAQEEERVRRLFADMQQRVSSGRWRDAAKLDAEIKTANPGYPGRAEAEKVITEHVRTLDLDEGVSEAERVAADPARCKAPKPISDAWNKMKGVKSTDAQWSRALKAVARLESCRQQAERELSSGMRGIMVAQREAWAGTADTAFLDQGMNATIALSGPNKVNATIEWALMSRAAAHKLTDGGKTGEGSFLGSLQKIGFRRVTFTDGFDDAWHYTLAPDDESKGGSVVFSSFGITGPLKLNRVAGITGR